MPDKPKPTPNPWEGIPPAASASHWGHLTLLREYQGELWLTPLSGEPYLADTAGGPKMMALRCDCGHEFEVEKSKFPGRKVARSCNRPECQYTKPAEAPEKAPSAAPGPRGLIMTVYLTPAHVESVRAYAKRRDWSFSKTVSHIVQEWLERQGAE